MSPLRYAAAEVDGWAKAQEPLIVDPLAAFRAAADGLEARSSLDVDEAIAGMRRGNVHDVQLRVSAALVAAGETDDAIVATLLDATRKAAGREGGRWNWKKEEEKLHDLCRSAREKGFGTLSALSELSAQTGSGGGKSSNGAGSETLSALSALSAQDTLESWPKPLGREAYIGLVGEIVDAVTPQTEADPAALLLQLLAAYGNLLGQSPHFIVGKTRHGPRLFVLTVGATSRGRKGTAQDVTRDVAEHVDETWARGCVINGDLSTGEGLINLVRDPVEKAVKDPKSGEKRLEIVDPGVADKRLLVCSSEFSGTLRMMAREGNTLSAVVRQAWDRGDLRSTSKNNPSIATGATIGLSGHITLDELRREMTATEAANGFANRFLFACVKRSKLLPDGGEDVDLDDAGLRLRLAADKAKRVGRMRRDDEAAALWRKEYRRLSAERPGMLGAVTARAEAQVLRLSMIYALLDGSETVRVPHLKAALEVWRFCEASAAYIFGRSLGDDVADTILATLHRRPEGLSRDAIRDLFSRHVLSERVSAALALLLRQRLVVVEETRTGGRPRTVYRATPTAEAEFGHDTEETCAESAGSAESPEKPSNGAASEPQDPSCVESSGSAESPDEPGGGGAAGPAEATCGQGEDSPEKPGNDAGSRPGRKAAKKPPASKIEPLAEMEREVVFETAESVPATVVATDRFGAVVVERVRLRRVEVRAFPNGERFVWADRVYGGPVTRGASAPLLIARGYADAAVPEHLAGAELWDALRRRLEGCPLVLAWLEPKAFARGAAEAAAPEPEQGAPGEDAA